MTRKEKILAFMMEGAYKPLLMDELISILDVPKEDIIIFQNLISEMEKEGLIIRTKRHRYGIPERMGLIVGRFQGHEKGFGFVIPDDETIADIFISLENSGGAMHNDRVIARYTRPVMNGKKAEGEIIQIIKRANHTLVGTFERSTYFGFVTPDDRKIFHDVFIPKDEFNGAIIGDKVIVKITRWPETRRNPEGSIVEIIGNISDPGTDIRSIIKQFNLNEEFPQEVQRQEENIPDKVNADEIRKRRDLRYLNIVTIDGEDAKDLDDAISVEKLSDGHYRLGVHIADVSHYVGENSPLDQEAFSRGTSVYLVDRVIPMLPKKLSNGICSLNPQVERLTLSVLMEIDNKGNVLDYELCESVIKTKERMTYTDVTRILVERDAELIERYKLLISDFELMQELALVLQAKRQERGSIDLNIPEAKIILDDNGKPIEIKKYDITISNQIIEEFMLACNETIAEHAFWLNIPFVYRVHEDPDPEKIENFNRFTYNLGHRLKGTGRIHPKALQQLLDKIRDTKEERIISMVMLRSLMKAKYSEENLGHFGLAAKYYCHFTSPIRRYPDLVIHRILKENMKNGINPKREQFFRDFVQEAAKHSSQQEVAAEEAERETEDLKKVEYMQDKVGEIFEGVVTGVTSFGIFASLENTIEGLVQISSMDDDYYIYDDERYTLIGEHTRKIYKIGDEVTVKLVKADVTARQIQFILFEEEENKEEQKLVKQQEVNAKKQDKQRKKKNKNEHPKKGKKNKREKS